MPSSSQEFSARIGRRVGAALTIAILILLALGATSVLLAHRVTRGYAVAASGSAQFVLIEEIEFIFHRLLLYLISAGRVETPPSEAGLAELHRELDQTLQRFERFHALGPERTPMDQESIAVWRRVYAEMGEVIAEVVEVGPAAAWKHFDRLQRISRDAYRVAEELETAHQHLVQQHLAAAQERVRLLTVAYLVALLSAGVLAVAATVVVRRQIVAPLSRLADTSFAFAEGKLDARVPVTSRDEIGKLAYAFNTMAERLQVRETEIRSAQAEVEQRMRETQGLYRIGMEVAALHELKPILQFVTEKARELLGAEAAGLHLIAGRAGSPFSAVSGPSEAFLSCEDRGTLTGAVSEHGGGSILAPAYRAAHLEAPLGAADSAIGFLYVGARTPRAFTAAERDLLAGLATQAAIAIQKAALYEKVQALAAVQERERLAREMHDGPAQTLGLLHLKLVEAREALRAGGMTAAAALEEAIRIAARDYDEVRQAIFGLRVKPRGEASLVSTLTDFLQEFARQGGVPVSLEVADDVPRLLAPRADVELIRIVQEALANVRKHARASRAWVRLSRDRDHIRLVIEDDGVGWHSAMHGARGFGLQTMRERAEGLGGVLTVDAEAGPGTRVTARLPLGA
jgi:nitrate/nitrite-specific signal transduction histidine kinase